MASEAPPPAGAFECNICLEPASEPVATLCGHIYCWGCIFEAMRHRAECPVCRAGVTAENVIPLYGRGANESDPREKPRSRNVPPRPQAQRPPVGEQPRRPPHAEDPAFNPFGSVHGVSFSAGFGIPGIFGMHYNAARGGGEGGEGAGARDEGQELSQMLLALGVLLLVCLLFF